MNMPLMNQHGAVADVQPVPDLCSALWPGWLCLGSVPCQRSGRDGRHMAAVKGEPLALPVPGWACWAFRKLIAPSSAPKSDFVEPGAQRWNAGPGAKGCAGLFLLFSLPKASVS